MIVRSEGINWMIHSTLMEPVGSRIGLRILPQDIHIMKKVAIK
jgi:spermidine/putrescine transport system ATP-binding protein